MSMQQEKENLQQELGRSQKDLGEAYHMKAELEMTREESFTLKSQLDEEEQNRYKIMQCLEGYITVLQLGSIVKFINNA